MTKLWQETKTIAVVGLSEKPSRPSYRVAQYMQSAGYRIIPVNPLCSEMLGETCYPDLLSIPEPIDMVNVFRKSEDCLPIVHDAVKIGAKVFWMQLGVINQEALDYAQAHGLEAIMDQCLMIEHMRQ
ncbi:CoA-binding protein [Polynucleobacter sp. 30F-ANTBAC]|jgi:predicted CoA-binding protein|uniref:CoA-binding protein n=1 Tax=Polynucleobacter sp. 30F-ANTBAC TaxID=2689095 RepID=UPI001C0CE6E3|nr:CoA-binding protein [Polynucleobacter sp. 30F-ANTBAC]MBU3598914.1 CoA-binding protein [Polynucleobacter sp. 30F-ANTBAC]